MNIDSQQLLDQLRHDYPDAYELASLKCLVELQAQEIDRLTSENARLSAGQPAMVMPPVYESTSRQYTPLRPFPQEPDVSGGVA